MAAPQIIINAILDLLGIAYRHGGHTLAGLTRDSRRAQRLLIAVDPSCCAAAVAPSRIRCGRHSCEARRSWSSTHAKKGTDPAMVAADAPERPGSIDASK